MAKAQENTQAKKEILDKEAEQASVAQAAYDKAVQKHKAEQMMHGNFILQALYLTKKSQDVRVNDISMDDEDGEIAYWKHMEDIQKENNRMVYKNREA